MFVSESMVRRAFVQKYGWECCGMIGLTGYSKGCSFLPDDTCKSVASFIWRTVLQGENDRRESVTRE